jgi:vacuolar-type H+-ATPase subunit D/Vma8
MHPSSERVNKLEQERDQLEERIHSIINEIHEIQRECEHMEDRYNSAFKEYSYNGINTIYECSICRKKTTKRP